MLGLLQLGVAGNDVEGVLAGLFEKREVVEDVADAELGEAVLAGTEELAGAALAEIGLGDLEAVGGLGHDLEPLGGLLAATVGDQDAEAVLAAAANAPAELVELGGAEAVGVLDDHDRRVGHVHADLDHGGGDDGVELSGDEGLDGLLLLGRFERAVQEAEVEAAPGTLD